MTLFALSARRSVFALTLALFLLLVPIPTLGQSPFQSPLLFGGHVPQAGASLSGVAPGGADLWALDVEGDLWFRSGFGGALFRLGQVRDDRRQPVRLIGIDFRPADGLLYGLDDRGKFYVIQSVFTYPVDPPDAPFRVPFTGGFQSLMDFNPVVDAVRLIASDDQNYAVVNNFTVFARQTDMSYRAGDVNAGQSPSISGGAYTNSFRITANRPAPTGTVFFGLDYTFHALVYIPPINGVSPTGGGQMQTIGRLQGPLGLIDLTPLSDCDIYTDAAGKNTLVGFGEEMTQQGRRSVLFAVDLDGIQFPALGSQITVRARTAPLPSAAFIDVAIRLN